MFGNSSPLIGTRCQVQACNWWWLSSSKMYSTFCVMLYQLKHVVFLFTALLFLCSVLNVFSVLSVDGFVEV